jgi:hypothetical protein
MNLGLKTKAFTLLLSALLGACGELTSGGVGEVEVWATADDPQGSPSASAPPTSSAVVPAAQAREDAEETAAAEGQLIAQLRAYIRADLTGEWIEITEGVRDITLDLNGSSERRAGVRFLDSGRYSGFRVVFQRVEATVTSGLIVGGVPILGPVRVDLGSQGTVTVERGLVLEVDASADQDIVLDLNASTWLPLLSLSTRTVSATSFASAVGVRLR